MGWERKRGKLQEFNRLLRGARDTTFVVDADFVPPPDDVRFVLTLDSDTILPIGAVAEMVGTLAHPLNRPQFDSSGRVVKGYGILQPRITPALPTRLGGTVSSSCTPVTPVSTLHLSGVGHQSGPVWRGHLHRQACTTSMLSKHH